MIFTYSGKYMDVTDNLKAYAEKKLTRLENHFKASDNANMQVRFSQERGGRNVVEVTMISGSNTFRAQDISQDMYKSLDAVVEKLDGQLRRFRTKWEKKRKVDNSAPIDSSDLAPAEDELGEQVGVVVRTKSVPARPMTVEDAIMHMDMSGYDFFLYNDAQSGAYSVVYRRNDGNYGLLYVEE